MNPRVLPNRTVAPGTKERPVTVSVVAGLPLGTVAGDTAVRTGTGWRTVKAVADWAVPPGPVTVIGPVVTPLGTTAVIVVAWSMV